MKKVTLFRSITAINEPAVVPIDKVLDGIKTGRWKASVEDIRNVEDKADISRLKKMLPCVCYAGVFDIPVKITPPDGSPSYYSCRTDESLSKHSGLVPIDIDDIDNVSEVFEKLKEDQFIYALWRSASGRGIHGLIKIGDGNKHRKHYNAILKKYRFLDTTARNESRVLFVSYDPDIYINKLSSIYYDIEDDEVEKSESAQPLVGYGQTDYRKIDIACKMIRIAPDGEKHDTLLRAAILMGGYVAAGKVERNIAEVLLHHEINKRNIDDSDLALSTIKDGINFGFTKPIHEIEQDFERFQADVEFTETELSFISSSDEDEIYIRKFKAGLINQGLSFGYGENFDKYFVLKEGEFYAFIGHSNIGKTASILWLILVSAVLHQWNWMIYAGENQPASIKMKLIEYLCGRKIKDIPEHWLKFAIRFVNDHFYIVSTGRTYEYKELLEFAEKLVRYKSLKGLFIDPYNSLKCNVTLSKSKYQYDYEAYTDMLAFTKRTKTTLFLSAHTTTEAQRLMDNEGNQKMPHATMVEGGAPLYNRCDNFLALHRKIKDPVEWMNTYISVDKVRNKETGGEPTPKADPLMIKMNKAVEFTDTEGYIPFDRDFLPKIETE